MNLYCCQFDIVWEDKRANFAKVRSMLGQAQPEAGSLILLPEMFGTGFSMNVAGIHENAHSDTILFLRELASDSRSVIVGGAVIRDASGRGLNQAWAVAPEGSELARYSKQRTFSPGNENQHYTSGSQSVTFCWHGWIIAPLICYDLRFPELFREGTRQGAQLFLVLANWPASRIEHWRTLARARAIENQAYLAAVNRCGRDPTTEYNGHSLVVSPQGQVLSEAGEGESVLHAEISREELSAYREDFPVLRDMR